MLTNSLQLAIRSEWQRYPSSFHNGYVNKCNSLHLRENVIGYSSADIICSKNRWVFRERSRKCPRTKNPSMFSRQVEAIVFIILQIFNKQARSIMWSVILKLLLYVGKPARSDWTLLWAGFCHTEFFHGIGRSRVFVIVVVVVVVVLKSQQIICTLNYENRVKFSLPSNRRRRRIFTKGISFLLKSGKLKQDKWKLGSHTDNFMIQIFFAIFPQ